MPDNEEKRKAAVGVVTPNADKDEDWRRQVAGVYSFGEDAATPGGDGLSATFRPAFSPIAVPLALLGG